MVNPEQMLNALLQASVLDLKLLRFALISGMDVHRMVRQSYLENNETRRNR